MAETFIHDYLQQTARSLLGTRGPIEPVPDAQPVVVLGGAQLIRLPALERGIAIPRRFFARMTQAAVGGQLGAVVMRTARPNVLVHVQRCSILPSATNTNNFRIGIGIQGGVSLTAFGDARYIDTRYDDGELNAGPFEIGGTNNGAPGLLDSAGALVVQVGAQGTVNSLMVDLDIVLVPPGLTGSQSATAQAQLFIECQNTNEAFTVSIDGVVYDFPAG